MAKNKNSKKNILQFLVIGNHIINLSQYKKVSVRDNKIELEDLNSNHSEFDVSKFSESVTPMRFSKGKNAIMVLSDVVSFTP